MVDQNVIEEFIDAVKQEPVEKANVYSAEVSRIDSEGTVWVHMAGSDTETPTAMSAAEVEKGDMVNVEWRNNKLYIAGNTSNPSAGRSRVLAAERAAQVANAAAGNAVRDAGMAREAAEAAQISATDAKTTADSVRGIAVDAQTNAGIARSAADSAMKGLGQVEDVVGVLEWITNHGEMESQRGETFDSNKVYFIVDSNGDYVIGGTHYSLVTRPVAVDIDSYYCLSMDRSIQNYVATHIVVDSEGLWIIPDSGGNKVLIATGGIGKTYETAGTYIVSRVGTKDVVLASFTEDRAQIGRSNGSSRIVITDGGMSLIRRAEDIENRIVHMGATASEGNHFIFGLMENTADAYDSSIEYEVGDLCEYDNNIYICVEAISTPEAWNPSHWDSRIIGRYSFLEGFRNISRGDYSHTEGRLATAVEEGAHAEGTATVAAGKYSHAEGVSTRALGLRSHAEGFQTNAGDGAHAEGSNTYALGENSHAEGLRTSAYGDMSHAEGDRSRASGEASHAQNNWTIAGYDAQTTIGKYNNNKSNTAFEIGNGSSDTKRSNAFEVDWGGRVGCGDNQGTLTALLDLIHPVGSYYWTSDGDFVPADVFGGTWEKIDAGVTLVSAGTGYTVRSGTAKDGGSANAIVPYHRHSVSEQDTGNMSANSSHSHTVGYTNYKRASTTAATTAVSYAETTANKNTSSESVQHTHKVPSHNTNYVGTSGNTQGANMPPYKCAYCWHRTA